MVLGKPDPKLKAAKAAAGVVVVRVLGGLSVIVIESAINSNVSLGCFRSRRLVIELEAALATRDLRWK